MLNLGYLEIVGSSFFAKFYEWFFKKNVSYYILLADQISVRDFLFSMRILVDMCIAIVS